MRADQTNDSGDGQQPRRVTNRAATNQLVRNPAWTRGDYITTIDRRKEIPIPRAFLSRLCEFRGPSAKVMLYLLEFSYGMGTWDRLLSIDEIHCGASRRVGIMLKDGSREGARPHDRDEREDAGVGLDLAVIEYSLYRLEEMKAINALRWPIGDIMDGDEVIYRAYNYGINWSQWAPLMGQVHKD